MISYEGWDREYQENRSAYLDIFEKFMSQTNYENNEKFEENFAIRACFWKRPGYHPRTLSAGGGVGLKRYGTGGVYRQEACVRPGRI